MVLQDVGVQCDAGSTIKKGRSWEQASDAGSTIKKRPVMRTGKNV